MTTILVKICCCCCCCDWRRRGKWHLCTARLSCDSFAMNFLFSDFWFLFSCFCCDAERGAWSVEAAWRFIANWSAKVPPSISPIAQCLPFALPRSLSILSTGRERESAQRQRESKRKRVCVCGVVECRTCSRACVHVCVWGCLCVCATFWASFVTPTHDRQSSSCSRLLERESRARPLSLSGIGQLAHRGARAICTGTLHICLRQCANLKQRIVIIAKN